jgi:hypothetical protein
VFHLPSHLSAAQKAPTAIRTAARKLILDDPLPGYGIFLARPQDRHSRRNPVCQSKSSFEQRLASKEKERLVTPHPRALSACEHKHRDIIH